MNRCNKLFLALCVLLGTQTAYPVVVNSSFLEGLALLAAATGAGATALTGAITWATWHKYPHLAGSCALPTALLGIGTTFTVTETLKITNLFGAFLKGLRTLGLEQEKDPTCHLDGKTRDGAMYKHRRLVFGAGALLSALTSIALWKTSPHIAGMCATAGTAAGITCGAAHVQIQDHHEVCGTREQQ